MRKTVYKLFWAWQFDKEEKWLNTMAARGLALTGVGFCRYEFEETDPGAYQICLELLEHSISHPESERYIRFLEGSGVEHTGSFWRWAYFRRPSSEGRFELYSDRESRVKYLKRIIVSLAIITGLNFYIGCYNVLLLILLGNWVSALGFLNIAISIFGLVGCLRLGAKRRRLKTESRIFE